MPDWTIVPNSSNVKAILYEPERAELHVRFRDGSTYTYQSVPDGMDRQMLDSDSPGRFVQNELALYQFKRSG